MTDYVGTKEFEGARFVRASLKGATMRFSDVSGVTTNTITFTWPTESTVSIQGSTNLADWTHLAYALGYSNTTTWT